MSDFITFLNQPLPIGIVLLIGMIILFWRMNDLNKRVSNLCLECKARLLWCIDHFQPKNTKGD